MYVCVGGGGGVGYQNLYVPVHLISICSAFELSERA